MSAAELFLPPVLASIILVLALWRTWICRREAWEWIAFSGLTGATATVAVSWPPVCQVALLPVILLGEAFALLALSAWRFAPDHGQHGFGWAWKFALLPTLIIGLGLTVGLLLLTTVFGRTDGIIKSVALFASALAGLAASHALLSGHATQMHRPLNAAKS